MESKEHDRQERERMRRDAESRALEQDLEERRFGSGEKPYGGMNRCEWEHGFRSSQYAVSWQGVKKF